MFGFVVIHIVDESSRRKPESGKPCPPFESRGKIIVDVTMWTPCRWALQSKRQRATAFWLHRFHSLMRLDAARCRDDLHRKMAHIQHSPRSLAAVCKRIRQNRIERFAHFQPVTQFVCHGAQLSVAFLFVFFFQRKHLVADWLNPLEFALAVIAEESRNNTHIAFPLKARRQQLPAGKFSLNLDSTIKILYHSSRYNANHFIASDEKSVF